MGNFIKASALAAAFALTGCVATHSDDTHNIQASGSNAGSLVVFALESLGTETVAISVNDHFIAPLQANKQFTQGLCSGSHQLEARSVNPVLQGRKVVRMIETQTIQIEPKQTVYVELLRSGNNWLLQPVGEEEWQAKTGNIAENSTDSNIVRRLTPALIKCNQN